jgi:hypothetical protein
VLRTEQRLHRLSPDFCLGAATTDTTAGDRPG